MIDIRRHQPKNEVLYDLCTRLLNAADEHEGVRRELLEAYTVILTLVDPLEEPDA